MSEIKYLFKSNSLNIDSFDKNSLIVFTYEMPYLEIASKKTEKDEKQHFKNPNKPTDQLFFSGRITTLKRNEIIILKKAIADCKRFIKKWVSRLSD